MKLDMEDTANRIFLKSLQALILDNNIQIISIYYQLCVSVLIKFYACEGMLSFLCAARCKYGKGGRGNELLGSFQIRSSLQRISERRMNMGLVHFRGRLRCSGIRRHVKWCCSHSPSSFQTSSSLQQNTVIFTRNAVKF